MLAWPLFSVPTLHMFIKLFRSILLLTGLVAAASSQAGCEPADGEFDTTSRYGSGWGIDHRGTRYQPASTVKAANVGNLRLKWAYGLNSQTPRSFPMVTSDTLYIGDTGRGVIALDRETGCERWVHAYDGPVTSAIVPGRIGDQSIVVFATRLDGIKALDASTGELIWHVQVEDEPVPMYSGTPLVTDDTVFIPLSSMEVGLSVNPFYGCCTTSGGIAAVDIATGEQRWYLPTIKEEAKVTGRHFMFVEEYGPSGAPVWAAPTYDPERNWLYFGTGQNYTHPTTTTSDAIFAVDAATGEVQWVRQFTENDAFSAACTMFLNHPNCAKPTGPDVDFGAPVALARLADGTEVLLAGQKSGDAHAMNPDTGEVLWSRKLGRGSIVGGVHWGIAVNEAMGLVFVPINDNQVINYPTPGEPSPGLYALEITTGDLVWSYSRPARCESAECVFGYSGAITATNDLVIAGNLDGNLEIFSARSGERLWVDDTWRSFDAVNQIETQGGAFDAHGPMVADDLVIVTSGYRYTGPFRGGNALLVYQVISDE